MIISNEHQFVFVHIPRTAGISMTKYLINSYKDAEEQKYRHYTYADFLAEHPGKAKYKMFAFVRNPWERSISIYSYVNKKRPHNQIDLQEYWDRVREGSRDGYWKNIVRTQCEYLKDIEGNIDPFFIGRFENLQTDIQELSKLLGNQWTRFPHANKSVHAGYREYYNDETKALVAEVFAEDIERFGYEF